MSAHLTSTDLDEWSRKRDSEAHLPTLVRKLVMATVRPDWIRMPAAEGVALPGLDGIVNVSGGAPPYVPAGDSAWECGTDRGVRAKAIKDYAKRTAETTPEVRARTTFVFVTSRRWGAGKKWSDDMKAKGDGWKDIVALAADELAIWLEMCPGVQAWLGEHLGVRSLGDTAVTDWFSRWSQQTLPETPAGVLVAGRRNDVIRVLDALDASPSAIDVAARSAEEAIAFVAAALTVGPGEDPETEAKPAESDGDAATGEHSSPAVPAMRANDQLEALRERTIVIEDVDGWRRWSVHATPHILIPTFLPDSIGAAVDAGHHVVLARAVRTGKEPGRLPKVDPHVAATAWQGVGVDFYKAQSYGIAARRNLGSIRRRLSRHGRQSPEWAKGPAASQLAAVLLAGSWSTARDGDQEVITQLATGASWSELSRLLMPLTSGEDPALRVTDDRWSFTDVVDAWDAIGSLVSAADLVTFSGQVVPVLTEEDPEAGFSGEERFMALFDEDRAKRRYSNDLRRGFATSLAVLGSLVGSDTIAGGKTGQTIATVAVRDLLRDSDRQRWLVLADLLELLAEASPDAFLDAVEASLRQDDPPIMGLFVETPDDFGGARSSHSSLLWALETLAFSAAHVSRACVALARLAALDPGGRWSNRPDESLKAALHLVVPQGVVNAENRLNVLDAVVAAVPGYAAELMTALVNQDGIGIIRSGARYRDWPTPRTRSNNADFWQAVEGICTRLLVLPATDLPRVVDVIGRLGTSNLNRVVETLATRWDEMDEDQQAQISETIARKVERHRSVRGASWAMPEDDLAVLDEFLEAHGFDSTGGEDAALFGWHAETQDYKHREGDESAAYKPVEERRKEVVHRLVSEAGIDAVIELAGRTEVPRMVGRALAGATNDFDEEVLEHLPSSEPEPGTTESAEESVAFGLANARSVDLGWLTEQVARRPDQAARLLLGAPMSREVIDLVDSTSPKQRELFWSRVSPYGLAPERREKVCVELISADRPFSAITAVASPDKDEVVSNEIVLLALRSPMRGTSENPRNDATMLGHVVGVLLNKLEADGVPDSVLAPLEFFYLGLLERGRGLRSLHRELGRDTSMFADMVCRVYKPDEGGEELSDASAEYEFDQGCYRVLRDWEGPLPGGDDENGPTPAVLQAWVDGARAELAVRNRSGIASHVIGQVLGAPTTDADGTWPCLAVRAVLEHEHDEDLESGVYLARVNQRGVTSRGVYSGGAQERDLAALYRAWSETVRDRWTRAGTLLEALAKRYEADGLREDKQSDRDEFD